MGLLEKSKKQNIEETPEEEYAHDVLVKLEDTMSHISPFRVIIVSIVALMIIFNNCCRDMDSPLRQSYS